MRIEGEMKKNKPKTAIVSMSEIAKHGGRLDPGYYLGTNEDRELEKVIIYMRSRVPSMLKRLWRACKGVVSAKLRVLRFRLEGRVKYK